MGRRKSADDRISDLIAEVGPAGDAGMVVINPQKRGPIPGMAIIESPHREEIDKLLFEERHSFRRVEQIVRERWGVEISRKAIARYVRYCTGLSGRQIAARSGPLRLDKIERSVKADWDTLDAVIAKAPELIEAGQVRMKHVLEAISIRQKYLGEHGAVDILTAEEKYGAALEAVLRVVMERCPDDLREQIQADLLADPDFTLAMGISQEPIEGTAELVEGDGDAS